MKKILTFLIVAALMLPAAAQGTRMGIEGGLNISTLTGMRESGLRSAPFLGGHVGFVSESRFNEYVGIRTGIGYSTHGVLASFAKKDIELLIGNYFTVPVLFSVFLADDRLLIGAGPQLGIAASMKERYIASVGDLSDWGTIKFKAGDDYNVLDLSVDVVVRYLFSDNLGIKFQYNFGLTDVLKPIRDHKGTVIGGANRNFVGQIGIVYLFDEF